MRSKTTLKKYGLTEATFGSLLAVSNTADAIQIIDKNLGVCRG